MYSNYKLVNSPIISGLFLFFVLQLRLRPLYTQLELIMKTLIIHPEDPTTTFLDPIYTDIPNQTRVQGNSSKEEVLDLIRAHDRVLMMGHGSPLGLLSMGKFAIQNFGWSSYIIDEKAVRLLKAKKESLFIWCHADKYANEFDLSGFLTGMFISEVGEAEAHGLPGVSQEEVDLSNRVFSQEVAKAIHLPAAALCQQVKERYGELAAAGNPIAAYNCERLYFN